MARKKVLGVDIDLANIRAVEVTRKGRQNVVTGVARQALSTGAVTDGKVTNASTLAADLRSFFAQQKFSTDAVVLGVRSGWLTVKTHSLPKMPTRELEKALEFEIPDLVSFPIQRPTDVAFDYFINQRVGDQIEVVVVACPRAHLDPYIKAFKDVGMSLESIDVPAFGWTELLPADARRCFIEISEEQTTIQLVLDGVFKIIRMVPLGIMHVRDAVGQAFEVSPPEAQELLESRDLDYLLTEGGGSKRVLRSTIQQFSGSVYQTLDFVRAQERASDFHSLVDEVVFIGDLADLAGLGEMLAVEMDVRVRSLQDMDNLQLSFTGTPPHRFNSFGSAFALGIRGLDE